MSNKFLYIAWGALYVACAGLGFIPSPAGAAWGLCLFFSLVFFLPPAILLSRAGKSGDQKIPRLIRNLSLLSLGLTLLGLVLNIASVAFSETMGTVLYYFLIVVSSPMVCSQVWVISLFLWACLLIASLQQLKKKK